MPKTFGKPPAHTLSRCYVEADHADVARDAERLIAECNAIRQAVGPDRLISITGNNALTGFTAPKLVWVRDHEPEVWRRARAQPHARSAP